MSAKESDKLLDFVTGLTGDRFLKVEKEIGSGYCLLNVGEAQRRQAKHDIRSVEDVVVELVRNSRDADSSLVFLASVKDTRGIRKLTIIDDGAGIPSEFHETIFEPRVTSKIDNLIEDNYGVHGRGMALYSIRSNVDDIELVASEPHRGAVFNLSINTNRLRERKDQSTFPRIKIGDNKIRVLGGPRNVWRHLVEISAAAPDLDIYYGTPSEILATSRAVAPKHVGNRPIWLDALISDAPDTLCRQAARLGLKISTRNCRRIISGEIAPLVSIKHQLSRLATVRVPIKRGGKQRTAPMTEEDLENFAQAIFENFRSLGEKYFIKLSGKPRVCWNDKIIKVELPVDSEDSW